MRLNREKMAAFGAFLILVLGLWTVIPGIANPTSGIRVPDTTLARSSREIVPRKYRTFTEESDAARNPFSFSEGWERMETTPMAHPPIPPLPRPVPLLWPGPSALEAGVLWQDRPPEHAAEKEGES
jgi:hypothetical protein